MRFWWVNQNQTFAQEIGGGYMWSPKKNHNGARNQFYENMREVAPGDVVYSFCQRKIKAIGIITSFGYECPKPAEFGQAGWNWDSIGWKVNVSYRRPANEITPREHMDVLRALLPNRHSPIRPDGEGNQVYLAAIGLEMGQVLAGLIGHEATELIAGVNEARDRAYPANLEPQDVSTWEDHIQSEIAGADDIPETDRAALIRARRGQGIYKRNLMQIETCCRVTKVDNPSHLIGSHIKPWRDSNNIERLDGSNGLLLTPNVDHLFDNGFISFSGEGELLVSPRADLPSLHRMGVEPGMDVGAFRDQQQQYLQFHRRWVFLKAA